ncbi:hypothetical protein D9M68_215800 [compost metagenome]
MTVASARPFATASTTSPPGTGTRRGFTVCAMPRRSRRPTRYAPLALSGDHESEWTPSSAFLTASTVLISEGGRSVRIAMPTIAFAMSVRVPAMTLPCPIRSSTCAGKRMITSNGSPASTCRFSVAALSNRVTSRWPVCCSNAGASSCRADFKVGVLSTLISPAHPIAAWVHASSTASQMSARKRPPLATSSFDFFANNLVTSQWHCASAGPGRGVGRLLRTLCLNKLNLRPK